MDKSLQQKLDNFFSRYTPFRYKKGDVLLHPEDNPPGILYLTKGLVQQSLVSQKGEVFVIHIFKPGSAFLLMWAINDAPNSYHFEALQNAEGFLSPLPDAKKFFLQNQDVMNHFTSRLLFGLGGLLTRLNSLMMEPAYTKTASLLTYLAQKFGQKNGAGILIPIPFTHKEIASWIGTTRETASLQLEEMKKRGLISYKKHLLLIKDLPKLQKSSLE